jgi:hypothetical protein
MVMQPRDDNIYILVGQALVGNLEKIPWFEREAAKPGLLRIR